MYLLQGVNSVTATVGKLERSQFDVYVFASCFTVRTEEVLPFFLCMLKCLL
jgi:hypothetical protein